MANNNIAGFKDFEGARRAIQAVNVRLGSVADKLERLNQAKNDTDNEITRELVNFGVRIGRITEHVPATTSISDMSHGYARLVSLTDYTDESDRIAPVYNITKKEYTVGTLVALLPVQQSYFIASDPGVFSAEILPLVGFELLLGQTFFEFATGATFDLHNTPAFITVAHDGSGRASRNQLAATA